MNGRPDVLVINDNKREREMISECIRGICTVVAPEDHADLCIKLKGDAKRYCLVVLDYQFMNWSPNSEPFNGADVMRKLRPNNEDRPFVLLLTSYPDDPGVAKLEADYNLSAHTYTKTGPDRLFREVQALLDRCSAQPRIEPNPKAK